MKRFSLLRIGALTAVLVSLAPLATIADENDKMTILTFSGPVEVPGIVLQPGTYVFKLLDVSTSRRVAEIMNEKMDHVYALTFTASTERPEPSGKPVITFYEGTNGRPPAVRTWFWPGETIGREFLYPKEQAARIAADTNQKVPEGSLPSVAESGQSLAPDNAKGSTLQSQNQSEPAATPVAASAAPTPPAAPVVIAQNTPAPPSQASRPADTPQSEAPAVFSNANSSDASLPQTASHLPLIGVIGIVSLGVAILIASVRRYRSL